MFRPAELFIGLRYTRARRRNHFISFISLTSILGMALGITALITVLSVMNGFQKEVRERLLSMAAHVTVFGADGTLGDWQEVLDRVRKLPHVVGAAPYVEGQAMLANGAAVSGALIRGVSPVLEPQVDTVGKHMVAGRLSNLHPGGFGIILGSKLAMALGVVPGDKVTVVTPQAVVTPAGVLPRLKRFTVVGVFRIGMYEYDRGVALIDLRDAQRLFGTGEGVTGVRIRLDNLMLAPRVARELASRLPPTDAVEDWTQQHVNYFRAVQTEKTAMFVILALIVAVAAFNIVSTLVMTVTDKQADIAILRTLGATPRGIMAVFIIQGTVIGAVGTLLGLAGGVALALNVGTVVPFIEQLFHVQFIPESVYLISGFPSDLHWSDVTHICTMAFVLAVLATLYPAWRASRTHPAEALRYE